MRALVFAIALDLGCQPVTHSPRRPEAAIESADLIDDATYTSRIRGVRATLARSSIAMDDGPTIRTCEGDHGTHCIRCDLASRAESAGVDPELLDGVALAFASYPTRVLAATKLEHVALCRRIRYEDHSADSGPAGLADLHAHRMLVSIEHFVNNSHIYTYFSVEQIVHHELFHLFDYATRGEAIMADREWQALNPRDFTYRDPAIELARPVGFIDAYATTNEVEDRASVFEYMMGRPSELCAIAKLDKVVAAKAAVVWHRFARLTGEAFMANQIGCIGPSVPNTLPKSRIRQVDAHRPQKRAPNMTSHRDTSSQSAASRR